VQRFSEMKHVPVSPVVREYVLKSGSPIDPVVTSLAARTADIGDLSVMMVPEEQAALMTMLTRILSARTVLDIGTFTGLSALSFARGVGTDGQVITCDVTEKWLGIAREHWERAGVADRIEFRLGPAAETLRDLPAGTVVDLAFLDADKENYTGYYEQLVPLLRPGGLLLVDNVLFNGYVLDPDLAPEGILRNSASALRGLNALLARDTRMETVMLPLSDGLTIARKKT
jgi:predicted O-methyltransferase YrrM